MLLQYTGILRINMNLYVLYINYTQKHNFEICFLIFALWILLGVHFCLRHFLSGLYFKTWKLYFMKPILNRYLNDLYITNLTLIEMEYCIGWSSLSVEWRSLLYKNWHSNYIWIWTLIAGRRGELITILYTLLFEGNYHKITYF